MNSKAAILFILITIVIDSTGLGIIIPSLPSLVAEAADVTLEESSAYYGYIVMSYALMQFIFSPLIGGLSDRYGRKPVLLLSLFGLAVDYVFMYYAPSLIWLVVGRCISGAFGASFTTAAAYIADVSSPENKTKNFGYIGAAFGIGFVLGPAIGGFLADYDLRSPFMFAAILSGLNMLYGLFVLKESLPVEKRRKFNLLRSNPIGAVFQMRKYKNLAGLFAVFFLYYFAAMAIQTGWVYYTEGKFLWSKTDVGLSLAVVGICIAIVQGGLTGRIAKTFGNIRTGMLGLLLFFLSDLAIAFASEGWMLYVLMIPYAFTGLAGPAVRSIMSNNTADDEQGELQGSLTSIMSLAEIIGPPVMMWVFGMTTIGLAEHERFYGSPFLLGSLVVLIALVIFAFSTRKK